MCHDYDSVLEMNGAVVCFIPTMLDLSHTYVSVRVSNEIHKLVMLVIKQP